MTVKTILICDVCNKDATHLTKPSRIFEQPRGAIRFVVDIPETNIPAMYLHVCGQCLEDSKLGLKQTFWEINSDADARKFENLLKEEIREIVLSTLGKQDEENDDV